MRQSSEELNTLHYYISIIFDCGLSNLVLSISIGWGNKVAYEYVIQSNFCAKKEKNKSTIKTFPAEGEDSKGQKIRV